MIIVIACGADSGPGITALNRVATIAVSLAASHLKVGDTTSASVTLRDASGVAISGKSVQWTSSNAQIAIVDSKSGVITGIGVGSTTITAASDGTSGSATVDVSPAVVPPAPVAAVSVTLALQSISVNATTQATATARDASGNVLTGRSVVWTSSNAAVATVDPASGVVTGTGAGSVTITATSEGIAGMANLAVVPAQTPIATLVVTIPNTTLAIGAQVQATATARDAQGNVLTGRPVVWTSSNPGIATIDGSTGMISGVATGTTTITAVAEGHSGTIDVSVSASPPPSGSPSAGGPPPAAVTTVSVTLASTSLTVGSTTHATAITADASGNVLTGRTIAWSSSNASIASVDASTGVVTAVAAGTASIVATSEGKSGSASIAVTLPPPAPVATVSVSLGSGSLIIGGTTQATATARDASGNVLTGRTIAWTSSNTGTATVSASGVVTGLAAGTTSIVATSESKTGQASLTVTVVPVATIAVTPASPSVQAGGTAQLSATLRDAGGNVLTGRTVTWTSSTTSVATISSSGLVTAVAAGTTTATAASGGVSGSTTVTVTAAAPPPQSNLGCANPQPGYIWCDDFESDRMASYFETDPTLFARQAGAGVNGSFAMHAHWTAGQTDAGSLKLAFGSTPSAYFKAVDAGTANYREIYWRFYIRTSSGWATNGTDKITRAIVFAGSNWQEAAIGHLWTGGTGTSQDYAFLDPASGTDAAGNVLTTEYNDFAHLTWLGAAQGQLSIFDAAHSNQWYCIETHMKLNDAGATNGVFEYWINGALQARDTNLNWLGAYSAYGINAIFLENYTNNGAAQAQDRYFDNFVVSTQPIGCSS